MMNKFICVGMGIFLVSASIAYTGKVSAEKVQEAKAIEEKSQTALAHPGKQGFQRCVACHLSEGQGIPGAFPPLKGRMAKIAATEKGRSYLVAVVHAGLMGQISVNGMIYMGVMPAQGTIFDAKELSDVLNYTVQVVDVKNVDSNWIPFSADEVKTLTAKGTPANGMETAHLRKFLVDTYPQLF